MRVLAIDQGTSGTKAVVVDAAWWSPAPRAVVRPAYLPDGRGRAGPGRAARVGARRRASGRRRGRVVACDAVALANQGETVLAWEPATGAPAVHRDRLAGPPGRVRVRRPRRAPRRGRGRHRARPRPVLLRAEDGLAPRHLTPRRRRDHDRHLADPRALRRVRHRRHHRQPVAAARPRRRRLGAASCSSCSASGRGAAADRRLRRGRRHHVRVRRRRARGRAARRPAGGPAGAGCRAAGGDEVHLRHRRVPAGEHRVRRHPVALGAHHVGGLAAARPRRPTASTVRSTRRRPRAVAAVDLGLLGDGRGDIDELGRGRRRERALRAGARRARRALVALRRHRGALRHDARDRARPTSSLAVVQGIAAQVAELVGVVADDLGAPRAAAAGRRRPHPLARAHAGAGRPRAGPGRRLPARPRDGAGRGGGRPLGLDAVPRRRPTSSAGGRPAHLRAVVVRRSRCRHLGRWRTAVAAGAAGGPTDPASTTSRSSVPAIVGCAIARELAGHDVRRRADRGARRRRRRHEQGQHRDPAHRLRRDTRHARVAPGAPWLRAAVGVRGLAGHPGRAHRRAARRLDRRASSTRSRRCSTRRGQRLRPLRCSSTAPTSTARVPGLGRRARSAG